MRVEGSDDPVVVAGHRIHIQSESVRGEGRWLFLECMDCAGFCVVLRTALDGAEGAFVGSGARAKAERALQALEKDGA